MREAGEESDPSGPDVGIAKVTNDPRRKLIQSKLLGDQERTKRRASEIQGLKSKSLRGESLLLLLKGENTRA